ncbi:MAG: B12-binding domain-containing radical SAM protein [Spirochaetales bacterium]|jgi:anaerobic magnesium-protoporphyrin IX monomethyl ester cyclase|nr:B12-binding domain-containing radical SAM protein [Spirochaetales bacterium]
MSRVTADITILNLNMLYLKYYDRIDRELHIPLGPLYLTRALEDAGFSVDFRDYQCSEYKDPFLISNCMDFLSDAADIIGISVMANLLPFALLLSKEIKTVNPDKTIILGGVGAKAVEETILEQFEYIDIIAYGEFDFAGPMLLEALVNHEDLGGCPNIFFRNNGNITQNPPCPRLSCLDEIAYPAYEKIDISRYGAINILTSRGCPFKCSFCSVAPIWDFEPYLRSADNIIGEIEMIQKRTGKELYLFQDEYFLASPERAKEFSRKLLDADLNIKWKAFGRVNLVDREAMELMSRSGCIELRFGVESGSAEILQRIVKGFDPEQAIEVISEAKEIFQGVDAFFVWGYPFESMDQFYQSVFLMNSFRIMGVRVLPSLLCYLPQTRIYHEVDKERLEFSYEMMPEYMITGHETCRGSGIEIESHYQFIYRFIQDNKDIFPGFYHYDIAGNILPKMRVLQEFGFYRTNGSDEISESCGAHSGQILTRV